VILSNAKPVHVTPLGDEFLLNDTFGEGIFPMFDIFLRACQMARPTSISHLPRADENILLEIRIPKFARTMLNPKEVDDETTYNMKPIPKIRETYKVDPKKRLLQNEFSPMEANPRPHKKTFVEDKPYGCNNSPWTRSVP
jgi:hypothetical protein